MYVLPFRFPFCHCRCQLFESLVSMILGMKGFLLKLFNLCVVDLRESLCSARLIVEPLLGCGDSCPHAMACSATIDRGGVLIAPC